MSAYPPGVLRLEPGLKLDRYELLCVLARGGMGSVWLARFEGKHGFERLVALKTVLPQHALEERFRRMFLDEAQLASRITHPNVAQTLDLGEQQGVLYFVMEWVDGDSLRKLRSAVKKKGADFPVSVALRIASDACAGLHAAHELRGQDGELLGVVHRDISPHNVLVSITGVTKVIDFGIAKAKERIAEETNTDELKGKVDYMAPEQAVGRAIDRRADIWSLGAVLHYLLSGNPPYDADTKVASLMARIEGKPPSPLPNTVPAPVRALVTKAMARDPEKRFDSCADMQRAIEEVMAQVGSVTTNEVASFVREHLLDSEQMRKRAVQVALEAAAERQKRIGQLEEPLENKRSTADSSEMNLRAPRAPASQTMSSTTGKGAFVSDADPVDFLPSDSPTAGMEAEVEVAGVPKRRGRGRGTVIAAFTALLLVGGIGLAFVRQGSSSTTGSVPVSTQVTAPVATDSIPDALLLEAQTTTSTTDAKDAGGATPLPPATSNGSVTSAARPVTRPPRANGGGGGGAKRDAGAAKPPPKGRIDDGF